jgi:hypothetical protein
MTSNNKLGEGMKKDEGKLRIDLVPFELIKGVAKVMEFATEKYAPWDYAKGYNYSKAWSAVQRHLWAWWYREENDPESGFSHLWHASAALAILLFFEARQMTHLDDRPTFDERKKQNDT